MSPTTALTDDDPTTEYRVDWWPESKYTKFPHIFEIDMNETNAFQAIRLGGTGNPNFYSMNSYLEIYLAPYNYSVSGPVNENDTTTAAPYNPSNYSINHKESLIWEGYFNTNTMDVVEFEKQHKGRYLMLKFINNSQKWKDGHPGRTCLSSVEVGNVIHNRKIYPMTNTRYITKINRWDEKRNGFYYNGKGYTGYAKGAAPSSDNNNKENSILEIRIPKLKPEFGIIGDYYPGMGLATVKLDGKEVAVIGKESFDKAGDERRLRLCSRSYRTVLFYQSNLDTSKQHKVTVEVTKGEVTLAGILTHQMVVTYDTDDWRYPRIIETEFNENPEQYNWTTPTDQLAPYNPPKPKKGGLSGGAIAAIVICMLILVAAAAVGVFFMYKKEILCFAKGGGGRFESTSSLI